jgi:hypothetical protein
MTFDQLSDFIQSQMRMAQVYQPVVLMTLLERGYKISVRGIARCSPRRDGGLPRNVSWYRLGRVAECPETRA